MQHYSTKEASKFLQDKYGIIFAESTLAKYRREGTGPGYLRLNGKIIYREIDLAHFIESAIIIRNSDQESELKVNPTS